MSHLSSERRTKILAGAVIAASAACTATAVQAAPLLLLTILGKNTTLGDAAFSSTVSVNPGDSIAYEIVDGIAPVGTANSKGTITSLTPGTDGISNAKFDIFQLSSDSPAIVANFTASGTINSAAGWNFVGNSGGTVTARPGDTGHNDLIAVRPIQGAGSFVDTNGGGIMATGNFVVASVDGPSALLKLRWDNNSATGSIKINGTQAIAISSTSELGSGSTDPVAGFTNLTLVGVPEPTSLSMLGLASLGLLARRKKA